MNKYLKNPDLIIDLHGKRVFEVEEIMNELFLNQKGKFVRIVTGKASFRENGPVLKNFVKDYLKKRCVNFKPAKITDGGEGAIEFVLG